jgi:FAD/FMN-containing dehydrogenase
MLAVPDPRAALDLLWLARERLGDGVSAFELISGVGLAMVAARLPEVRQPLAGPPEWSVLVDVGLPEGPPAEEALAGLAEAALERGLASDGAIAQSEAQRAQMWQLRESLPEANRLTGSVASHDVSVPLSEIPALVERGTAAVAALGPLRVNAFGHVGDGNLHFNAFALEGADRAEVLPLRDRVVRTVHDLVDELGGSISAEHGIGRFKAGELERYGDPAKLAAMRAIKAALDPHGIMNPGAVLARR